MPWHYLKPNRSTAQPTQFIVFDTETFPEPLTDEVGAFAHKFRLGAAVRWRWEGNVQRRREQIAFDDLNVFWEWVCTFLDFQRNTWVLAHNLGFDLTTTRFWERLEKGQFSVKEPAPRYAKRAAKPGKHKRLDGFCCIEDPPTILKLWHQAGQRVTFLDTLNFWPHSLGELGRMVGRPKGALPAWTAPKADWASYCLNDAMILEQAVLDYCRFVSTAQLGKLGYTAPAQAMAAFRHRFMPHRVCFHDDQAAHKLERAAYYNGRCEAFFRGRVVQARAVDWWGYKPNGGRQIPTLDGPTHHLDACALYPAVMAAQEYPSKLIAHLGPVGDPRHYLPCDLGACIGRVLVETDYPLPVRVPERGTLFATGKFTTCLAGDDLVFACNNATIWEWHEVCGYELADLFSPFVEWFWLARCRFDELGQTSLAGLCKLFMNALYGKWAQRTPEWIERPDLPADMAWGSWPATLYPDQPGYDQAAAIMAQENPDFTTGDPVVRNYRALGGQVQECRRRVDAPNTLTAISAFVTAYGRWLMEKYRVTAGYREVFYQGIDSLHVSTRGLLKLVRAGFVKDRAIGLLRPVSKWADVRYHGPADYTADGKLTRAGWKDTGDFDDKGIWHQNRFQGLAQIVAAPPAPYVVETDNTLTHRADRRQVEVGKDGWIKPIRLG